MAGTIIGWILLGLLGLLLVVLLAPAAVGVDFRAGALTVTLRVLFVKLTVFPMKQRAPKPAKKRGKEQPREEKPEKEKKKRTFDDILKLVKRISSAAGKALRIVLRFVWLWNVEVVVPIGGSDAAQTALNYGKAQAAAGTLRALLENLVHVRWKRIELIPDFTGQNSEGPIFACKVVASPVIMLAAGIAGLWRFLVYKPVAYSKADYLKAREEGKTRGKMRLFVREGESYGER